MRLWQALPLVLVLSACGSGPAAAPNAGAPKSSSKGPPAAWIETKAGSDWLGFSSWCWNSGNTGICADAAAPQCGQEAVPNIRVERGEAVRAHLGYTPEQASVEGANAELHGRVVSWNVEAAGPFLLFTKGEHGDASYVGCALFS
jgi:hypothetical protein